MTTDPLEPLYEPWQEPTRRREKNPGGGPALIVPGRRPSRALLVRYVRGQVSDWRAAGYPGATETTKLLLLHWFETAHESGFRYHYCQREAVETAIWLYEVAQYRCLSDMLSSLVPEDYAGYAETVAAVTDAEDAWARYCSKIATGGGKTKCMSLMIAWSYFNSLRESADLYPRHFVVIAPNLIVFDRLLDDFGGGKIFATDPVIPPDLAGDFRIETVRQDEPGGESTTGALYLTNIHRLYERERAGRAAQKPPSFAGPDVKAAQVFRTGERLRDRITGHPSVMVVNDEAHHLHDIGSSWNEAIRAIHEQSRTKGNAGVRLQMDYTATPRRNDGRVFRHVVSDSPLGEAVDSGIVKVPVIGVSAGLTRNANAPDAFEEYRQHLLVGYKAYERSYEQWEKVRKPILFVMTESAAKADEIARSLGSDPRFPLLTGKVLNLHTRLKGKIVERREGARRIREFVPDEKGISDDDLRILRELSSKLDSADSPYRCVVSVLMLREGWDVRNVTTIIPLRPYSAESNILAEQTLGRGLRRMLPSGGVAEIVSIVEHEAFTKLYTEELAQEGLDILVEQLDSIRPESVTIFVDRKRKSVDLLEIEVPRVTDAIETAAVVDEIAFEDIAARFEGRYPRLPVGMARWGDIDYTERALLTDEIVGSMRIDRGLLQLGSTAIGYFVRELEKLCGLQSTTAVLAPLVQRFIEELLFERPVSVYSGEVDGRMGDPDVAEYIRAVFLPVIRAKTVRTDERKRINAGMRLSTWQDYQATKSDRKPCIVAERTMFNLVPCDRSFEAEFAGFMDSCKDVAAFAKNAGPQKLAIDYLSSTGRRAFYWPDFFVRLVDGRCMLAETKGAADAETARKAKAAVEWCRSASAGRIKLSYLYMTMPVFEQNTEFSLSAVARAAEPSLKSLLESLETTQAVLPFDQTPEEVRREKTEAFTADIGISALPPEIRVFVDQAVNQLDYDVRMGNTRLNLAFTALLEPLEGLCGQLIVQELTPHVPAAYADRPHYFEPYIADLPNHQRSQLEMRGNSLRRNIIDRAHNNRVPCFLFCLRAAREAEFSCLEGRGIWSDVRAEFGRPEYQSVYRRLDEIVSFRNNRAVHTERPLTDVAEARENLTKWIEGLVQLAALAR